MTTRTHKRSASRAHHPCPICAKRLAGAKGLIAHLAERHAVGAELARTKYGLEVRRK